MPMTLSLTIPWNAPPPLRGRCMRCCRPATQTEEWTMLVPLYEPAQPYEPKRPAHGRHGHHFGIVGGLLEGVSDWLSERAVRRQIQREYRWRNLQAEYRKLVVEHCDLHYSLAASVTRAFVAALVVNALAFVATWLAMETMEQNVPTWVMLLPIISVLTTLIVVPYYLLERLPVSVVWVGPRDVVLSPISADYLNGNIKP
jgi:hypothetical protein